MIKEIVKQLLYQSGYYGLRSRLMTRQDKKLLILMYHDIDEDRRVDAIDRGLRENPSRSIFAAHMKTISRHCRVISMDQAVNEITNEGCLKENSVAITFDDGYASVYHIAFPILHEFRLPATIFATTDWINGEMTFWWDRLTGMVQRCDLTNIDVSKVSGVLGSDLRTGPSQPNNSLESKRTFLESIESNLRNDSTEKIQLALSRLGPVLPASEDFIYKVPAPLSWSQLEEMARSGIGVAAHTRSHTNLSFAATSLAEEEMAGSKREIEERLVTAVTGFAYPYGNDIEAYAKLVPHLKRLGFNYACTTSEGSNGIDSNPYLLQRISLPLVETESLLHRILYLGFCSES